MRLWTNSDLDMMCLQHGVHEAPGCTNRHDIRCPSPPLPLQFTEFVLRKYLALRFADDAFNLRQELPGNPYLNFVADGSFLTSGFKASRAWLLMLIHRLLNPTTLM